MNAGAKGSTRRWRNLRAIVIARQTRPGQPLQCQRCHTPVHPKCSTTQCPQCLHIHHLDGTGRTIDHVHPNRLALWCAGCNWAEGKPQPRPQHSGVINPMTGVTRR